MKLAVPLAVAMTVALGGATAMNAAGTAISSNRQAFAMRLYSEMAKNRKKENLLISPYSVSTALTMTYMGATGDTKKEMADVLDLTGGNEEIGARSKQVSDSLKNPGADTKLEIANALFARQDVKFKDEFLNSNKEYFDAKVSSLDFKSASAASTINQFVNNSTHGKIARIVSPPLRQDMILYLVNAIYFKGSWAQKFEKSATKPDTFHLIDGKTKQVQMMNLRRNDFSYFETPQFQAINLGYADKRLSMYIFLPKTSSSIDAFEAQLSDVEWAQWKSKFRTREGKLSMPRFKIEDSMKLNASLQSMGMKLAFAMGAADFSAMNVPERPYISEVMHKTFMEVNEEGTEAAAVTSVGMAKTTAIMNTPPPFTMVVDRPYFIAIRDHKTDTLLFVGRIVDPS